MARVSGNRVRIGTGEIVPRKYELASARREFFATLWELVPEALESIFEMNRRGLSGLARVRAVRQWQEAYRLPDEWAHKATWLPSAVEEYFVDLIPTSIYEGRERAEMTIIMPGASPYVMRSGMIRNSDSFVVLVAHLLYEDPETGHEEWPGDADIGDFDPRVETIDQAVKRILPVLEHRLRYGLRTIMEQDRAGDTVPVRPLPSRQHFEWTVRYQVLGETFAQVAEADDVERITVSRNVRRVAALIGLTLRPPDTGDPRTGGRPKKQKTRTAVRRTTKW